MPVATASSRAFRQRRLPWLAVVCVGLALRPRWALLLLVHAETARRRLAAQVWSTHSSLTAQAQAWNAVVSVVSAVVARACGTANMLRICTQWGLWPGLWSNHSGPEVFRTTDFGKVCRWPGADPQRRRFLLYVQGGGCVVGAPRDVREFTATLSRRCDASVVVLQYPKLPDGGLSTGVDRCLALWDSLRRSGLGASNIVVAGDSAGAAIVLLTVAALQERGDVPALVVLISPILYTPGPPQADDHTCPVLPLRRYMALINGITSVRPEDAALFRLMDNYHSLLGTLSAPLHLLLGTLELGAARLRRSAVSYGVEVTEVPLFHDAVFFHTDIPEAADALGRVVRSIRRAWVSVPGA